MLGEKKRLDNWIKGLTSLKGVVTLGKDEDRGDWFYVRNHVAEYL